MQKLLALIGSAFSQTLASIARNWPYLLASVLVAAALTAFVDPGKVAAALRRRRGVGVLAATGAAVATPFCSCGTTAVVLGMMAGAMPMAPIVAFMVASPLSSPGELVYGAGLFGWNFALFHFAASAALGLAGGGIAAMLERRGLLAGQARFRKPAEPAEAALSGRSCSCSSGAPRERRGTAAFRAALRLGRAAADVGKRLLPLFALFAFVGYLLNGLIPAAWIPTLFGRGRAYAVPLAATLGLPLYVNSEASLPLAKALLGSGMSQGAIMAFLIAGSGTSVGAIAGALAIARRKVVALVVAVLWLGAMVAGYAFDALVAAGIA